MKSITQIITEEVSWAIEEEGLGGILPYFDEVRFTKNPKHGDIQSNHAFDIALSRVDFTLCGTLLLGLTLKLATSKVGLPSR